jgi:hypothetical protein
MIPRTRTNSPIPADAEMVKLTELLAPQRIEGKSRVEPKPYLAHALWLILFPQALWAHPAEKCGYGDTELFRQLGSGELATVPQNTHSFILLFRCLSLGSPETAACAGSG